MDLKVFSQEVHLCICTSKSKKEVNNLLVSALLILKIRAWLWLPLFLKFFFFPLTRTYVLGVTQRKDYFLSGNPCYGLVFLLLKKPIEM